MFTITGRHASIPGSNYVFINILTSPGGLSNQDIAWVTGVGSSGAHTK